MSLITYLARMHPIFSHRTVSNRLLKKLNHSNYSDPIITKVIISQWELKMKTNKPPKELENTIDHLQLFLVFHLINWNEWG